MKIEFLADDNPLYVLPFFEEFCRHYASEFEVAQISSCRPMGKRSRRQLLQRLTVLYGPVGMARLAGRWAIACTLGLIPRGRTASQFYTLAQLCRAYSIPFARIGDPNQAEFVNGAQKRACDAIISVACPYILKEPLLSLPVMGCINVHHSPLPRYRGMMPTFWQMYHGEQSVGLTVHYMAARIDEGAAIVQESLTIEPGESLDHLIRRSKRHGAHAVARALRRIASQSHPAVKLNATSEAYFTFPTVDQFREFRRRGFRAL
jgi:methionyl-tRNA formyltransferase